MKIETSGISKIDLIGPGSAEFHAALELLLGREPDDTLRLAARYSVIVRNGAERAIALLGVRFDMLGEHAKRYSVVHYADALRNPEKADLTPGSMRFICAEPLYTELVLRRNVSQREADKRARMNLDNLAKAKEIGASLDCAAFDDGHFAGPDTLGAFERLRTERQEEMALVDEVLQSGVDIEALLISAMEIRPRRTLARRLLEGWLTGGAAEVIARAKNHRPRIELSR